jgi:hypothetical protein
MEQVADFQDLEARALRLMDAWFPSYRRIGRSMMSSKLVNFFRDLNKFYNIGPTGTRRIFDDKLLFSSFLSGIGINTPASRWIVSNDIAFNSSGQRIPTSALLPLLNSGTWFVKRRSGSGGRGALMLDHGTVTKADGSIDAMSEPDLLEHLKDDKGFLEHRTISRTRSMDKKDVRAPEASRLHCSREARGRASWIRLFVRWSTFGMMDFRMVANCGKIVWPRVAVGSRCQPHCDLSHAVQAGGHFGS